VGTSSVRGLFAFVRGGKLKPFAGETKPGLARAPFPSYLPVGAIAGVHGGCLPEEVLPRLVLGRGRSTCVLPCLAGLPALVRAVLVMAPGHQHAGRHDQSRCGLGWEAEVSGVESR
jgi:hypothetical protein